MPWTDPVYVATGDIVTAAKWNTEIADNLKHLFRRLGQDGLTSAAIRGDPGAYLAGKESGNVSGGAYFDQDAEAWTRWGTSQAMVLAVQPDQAIFFADPNTSGAIGWIRRMAIWNSGGVLIGSGFTNPGANNLLAEGVVSWLGMAIAAWNTPGTYSWTVPGGVYRVRFIVTGGGGGGGSGAANTTVDCGPGCGGGGGGTVIGVLAVTPGETLKITVGAGGAGGAAVSPVNHGNPGATGGASKISRGATDLVVAYGGAGGGRGLVGSYGGGNEGPGSGGAFSVASGVNAIGINGGSGNVPAGLIGPDGTGRKVGGLGGGSFWGGPGPFVHPLWDGRTLGIPYGCGGGGGAHGPNGEQSRPGRDGGSGVVMIFY